MDQFTKESLKTVLSRATGSARTNKANTREKCCLEFPTAKEATKMNNPIIRAISLMARKQQAPMPGTTISMSIQALFKIKSLKEMGFWWSQKEDIREIFMKAIKRVTAYLHGLTAGDMKDNSSKVNSKDTENFTNLTATQSTKVTGWTMFLWAAESGS